MDGPTARLQQMSKSRRRGGAQRGVARSAKRWDENEAFHRHGVFIVTYETKGYWFRTGLIDGRLSCVDVHPSCRHLGFANDSPQRRWSCRLRRSEPATAERPEARGNRVSLSSFGAAID
jgi:hypothetical protein